MIRNSRAAHGSSSRHHMRVDGKLIATRTCARTLLPPSVLSCRRPSNSETKGIVGRKTETVRRLMKDDQKGQHVSGLRVDALSRRKFMSVAAVSGVALTSLGAATEGERMTEEIEKEKIRRAMLAGPAEVTADATVGEVDHLGNLTVLPPRPHEWEVAPRTEDSIRKDA